MTQINDVDWALDAFQELSEICGAEALLGSPLILPTDECFPDVLAAGALGSRQLTRRMMRHAGLGHLPVDLFEDPAEDFRSPIQFEGIDGELSSFSFHEELKPEITTGFLCFEVAQAFRAHHGLRHSTGEQWADEDTASTDTLAAATAVFLGFGVLALNASDTYEQGGHVDGHMAVSEWTRTRAGGLAVGELAEILALWTFLRDSTEKEQKVIARHLSANQKAAFRKARKRLREEYERDELLERVGLDSGAKWKVRSVDSSELPAEDQDTELGATELRSLVDASRVESRRVVYRVIRRKLDTGCFTTLFVAFVVLLASPQFEAEQTLAVGGAMIVLAALFGFRTRRFCSDRYCRTTMKLSDNVCPRCKIPIAGDVSSRAESLDMPTHVDEQTYRDSAR